MQNKKSKVNYTTESQSVEPQITSETPQSAVENSDVLDPRKAAVAAAIAGAKAKKAAQQQNQDE